MAMDKMAHSLVTQLMHFPDEILLHVLSRVQSYSDLCSLARSCRRLQALTEPLIYHTILIRSGDAAKRVSDSMPRGSQRSSSLESLLVSCPFDAHNGIELLQDAFPRMSRLRRLRIETPDCNSRGEGERVHWRALQERYRRLFDAASLLKRPGDRILGALRHCTVHFVDESQSTYSLEEYGSIFLLPQLETLSLSCARVSPEISSFLRPWQRSTALKNLMLEQCDMSPSALGFVLAVPKSLEALHLSENFRPSMAGPLLSKPTIKALRSQFNTLSSLTLLLTPHANADEHLEKWDFSSFNELKSLEFGQIPIFRFRNTAYMINNRIGLEQVIFPPNMQSFKYSNIQTHKFPENIEILKNTFYDPPRHPADPSINSTIASSSTPGQQTSTHSLTSLTILLPLESHDRVPSQLMQRLSIPALYFADRGIRYRLLDTLKPQGFIPPYLFGEYCPEETVLIDGAKLPQSNGRKRRRSSSKIEDHGSNYDDALELVDHYRHQQAATEVNDDNDDTFEFIPQAQRSKRFPPFLVSEDDQLTVHHPEPSTLPTPPLPPAFPLTNNYPPAPGFIQIPLVGPMVAGPAAAGDATAPPVDEDDNDDDDDGYNANESDDYDGEDEQDYEAIQFDDELIQSDNPNTITTNHPITDQTPPPPPEQETVFHYTHSPSVSLPVEGAVLMNLMTGGDLNGNGQTTIANAGTIMGDGFADGDGFDEGEEAEEEEEDEESLWDPEGNLEEGEG